MSTRLTGVLSRPTVYRAPDESASGRGFSSRPTPRHSDRPSPDSETDHLLRRSHALMEQLRRAVEARQNLI